MRMLEACYSLLAIFGLLLAAQAKASDSACYEPSFSKSQGKDCLLLKQERLAVETELALIAHRLAGKALTDEQEQALLASHTELYGGQTPATYDLKILRDATVPALRTRQRELNTLGRSLKDCPGAWKPIAGSQGRRRRSIEPSKTCKPIKTTARNE